MSIPTTIAKWRLFFGTSPLRRLGQDAVVVASTNLAARGIGFLKEIVVAAHFGISGNLDIYFVAYSIIGFPISILLNAVQTVLIVKLSGEIRKVEQRWLYTMTASSVLILMSLMLILWLLLIPHALPWLASGFPEEKRAALWSAITWMIPYYFLNSLNLLGYGVLQAKRCYLINGLLSAITPVTIIIGVLIAGSVDDWRVLAGPLVVGSLIECGVLQIILFRMGYVGAPRISTWKEIIAFFSQALTLLPSTAIGAFVVLVEQAIAASLGEGSNAALLYGYRFPSALQSLVVTSIGITALPYFASQISKSDLNYSLYSLERLLWILSVGGGVIGGGLALFSPEITTVLYQRGVFDASATARVVPVQTAYFIQIPFAMLSMLGVKTLAALGHNGMLSIIAVAGGVFQCVIAYFLSLKFGVPGIAWGATLASLFTATATILTARARLTRCVV